MNTTERRPRRGTAAQETGAGRQANDTTEAVCDGQLTLGQDSPAREHPGIQRAQDNADDWWWLVAMRAMGWLADTHTVFEAYDLTLLGVPDPAHPNHWGALFRAASTAGTIEPAGYARAKRPTRAGGLCRVWIGTS